MLTGESGTELGNSGRSAQINRLVSKVNLQTSHNTLVDLVDEFQVLALGELASLQCLFETLHFRAAQRFGRGDGDDEFAPVSGHQGGKVGDDVREDGESAVSGEDLQKVGEDGGRSGRGQAVDDLGSLVNRQGGVACWRVAYASVSTCFQ